MAAPSLIMSRRDLEFLLYEWLDVESLTARKRFADHSRETFDGVLGLAEDIATEKFLPHRKKADAEEPVMLPDGTARTIPEIADALKAYVDAGFLSASFDEEFGGQQLPSTVARAASAWFAAASIGTTSYANLTVANAHALIAHGSPEQIDTWVRPMIEGRWFGTMCLSEPHAGSSLTDITTKAIRQDDGTYAISGSKMWISAGDHEITENIVHLVLAKVPGGPAGVKGISMFIVPKYRLDADGNPGERNGVSLAGLNHKMGYRGTTNALLSLENATGYQVGEEHRGLTYMFHMMNEARVGVGLGATALGYTGYLHAVDYAKSRTQGRAVDSKDPSTPAVRIIEHADVRRMLLAQKAYAEGALAFGLYCSRLVDDAATAESEEDRDRAALLLDVLTPIAKSWPSQWCLEGNSLAIQVHGGYGYTRDYDVEQLYRDNRLNAIHEGTHGIHALDLLGRKVVMKGGAGLGVLADAILRTTARARDAGDEAAALAEQLDAVVARIGRVTQTVWAAGDVQKALANATVYLEAVGHTVLAWTWLEQYLAAEGKDGAFYDGKRQAARYFFRWELPRTGPQLDLLATLDTTTLEMDETWF